jgi:hypothetical protein
VSLTELVERDYLQSVWQALRRIEAALSSLTLPPPEVNVTAPPPDLADIVTAVTSLKPGPSAEDIARALAGVLAPTLRPDGGSDVLGEVARALEKLDFRLQGVGAQAYGGGSVTITPGSTVSLAKDQIVSLAPDQTVGLTAATLAALETVTVNGVVGLEAASLSALENTTVTQLKTTTSARSTVSAGLTSVMLIGSNPNRKGLSIFNDTTGVLSIAYANVTVSTINFDTKIPAGATLTLDMSFPYIGQINGIWDTAVGFARLVEF